MGTICSLLGCGARASVVGNIIGDSRSNSIYIYTNSWITILLYVREGLADAAIFMYVCADSAAVMLLFRPRALGRKDGWLVQLAQTWTLTKNDAGPLVSTRQIYIATGEQG